MSTSGRRGSGSVLSAKSRAAAPPLNFTPSAPSARAVKKWTVDSNGHIVDFRLQDLRSDVLYRLDSGAPLYTTEECRTFLVEMSRVATQWQAEEMGQLLYLSHLHQKLLPGIDILFQWPLPTTSSVPFSKPLDPGNEAPVHRLRKVVEELNRSLVRVIDQLWNDRRERLLLAARILRDIEGMMKKESS